MPRPMPVEPRFSRRFSILNSIPSDFSSSLRRPISSLRMSSFVVAFELQLDRVFREELAQFHRRPRSSWTSRAPLRRRDKRPGSYPSIAQVVSNLRRCTHFRGSVSLQPYALSVPRRPRRSAVSSPPWRGCRSRRSGASAASFGADVVVTEFLSAEGIRRENEATLDKLRFGADERPIGVQIFGADPEAMGDAAALVTDVFQPEFIDINFGCPVKKVVQAERRLRAASRISISCRRSSAPSRRARTCRSR